MVLKGFIVIRSAGWALRCWGIRYNQNNGSGQQINDDLQFGSNKQKNSKQWCQEFKKKQKFFDSRGDCALIKPKSTIQELNKLNINNITLNEFQFEQFGTFIQIFKLIQIQFKKIFKQIMQEQIHQKLEENLLDDLTRQFEDVQRAETNNSLLSFINKLNNPSTVYSQEEYLPQEVQEDKENININIQIQENKLFALKSENSDQSEQKCKIKQEIGDIKPDVYENSNFILINDNSVGLVQDSILKTKRSQSQHSLQRQNSIKFEISPPRNLITEEEKNKIMNRQPTPYTKTEKVFKSTGLDRNTLNYAPIPINPQNARNTLNQAIQMFKQPNKKYHTAVTFKQPFMTSEVPHKALFEEKILKCNDVRYKPSNIAKFCVQCDKVIQKDEKTHTLPCCHRVHTQCQEKAGKRQFQCPKCNNHNRFIK